MLLTPDVWASAGPGAQPGRRQGPGACGAARAGAPGSEQKRGREGAAEGPWAELPLQAGLILQFGQLAHLTAVILTGLLSHPRGKRRSFCNDFLRTL